MLKKQNFAKVLVVACFMATGCASVDIDDEANNNADTAASTDETDVSDETDVPSTNDTEENATDEETTPSNSSDTSSADTEIQCECDDSADPCCDGCNFENTTFVCETISSEYRCDLINGDCAGTAERRDTLRYCTGDAVTCEADTDNSEWVQLAACNANQVCFSDDAVAECRDCNDFPEDSCDGSYRIHHEDLGKCESGACVYNNPTAQLCDRCEAGQCLACEYGSDCQSGICNDDGAGQKSCATGCNILVNGSAQDGMNGWEEFDRYSDSEGWTTTGHSCPDERNNHAFQTSHSDTGATEWSTKKRQTVDLVSTVGYSIDQLAAIPDIWVSEYFTGFSGGGGSNDSYLMTAQIRDSSNVTIQAFNTGKKTATDGTWTHEQHIFSGYGTPVRYIYFEDEGTDNGFWDYFYGVVMDGAKVSVLGLSCPSCYDGIQNQTETGIDCGGPCNACP